MLELLENTLKRLNYVLTITHDIRIAGEIHLAIEEIQAVMTELLLEGE